MDGELRGADQLDDFRKADFAGVEALKRYSRLEAQVEDTEDDRVQQRLVAVVKRAVYEDVRFEAHQEGRSALRLVRDLAIGVPLTDAAIGTVHEQLAASLPRQAFCVADRLGLSVERLGRARRAGFPNAPAAGGIPDDVVTSDFHFARPEPDPTGGI